jgi:hypothetical protein
MRLGKTSISRQDSKVGDSRPCEIPVHPVKAFNKLIALRVHEAVWYQPWRNPIHPHLVLISGLLAKSAPALLHLVKHPIERWQRLFRFHGSILSRVGRVAGLEKAEESRPGFQRLGFIVRISEHVIAVHAKERAEGIGNVAVVGVQCLALWTAIRRLTANCALAILRGNHRIVLFSGKVVQLLTDAVLACHSVLRDRIPLVRDVPMALGADVVLATRAMWIRREFTNIEDVLAVGAYRLILRNLWGIRTIVPQVGLKQEREHLRTAPLACYGSVSSVGLARCFVRLAHRLSWASRFVGDHFPCTEWLMAPLAVPHNAGTKTTFALLCDLFHTSIVHRYPLRVNGNFA